MTDFILNHKLPNEYFTETENSSKEPTAKLFYDCFAVSNHSGGLGGGHYTAYVKCKINDQYKWYDFNDSSVHDQGDNVVSSSAYVLFFRRRK